MTGSLTGVLTGRTDLATCTKMCTFLSTRTSTGNKDLAVGDVVGCKSQHLEVESGGSGIQYQSQLHIEF